MDKNLYYDQVTNRCNIFGCVIFTKTTPEAIREIIGKRYAGQYTRMRSRVVKKFDNYYFKEITGDELKKKLDDAFILRDDITSISQMEKIVNEE
jgi:hypothetical protein